MKAKAKIFKMLSIVILPAAEKFEKILKYGKAAKCYFESERYPKAADLY